MQVAYARGSDRSIAPHGQVVALVHVFSLGRVVGVANLIVLRPIAPTMITARTTATANQGSVSMRVVSAVLDVVERAGVERGLLLRAAGISTAQLEAPEARLPESEIRHICELALEASGDSALGLHWGERLTVDTFAPVSYLVTHAPSLQHALQAVSEFSTLLSDQPSFRIEESAQHVSMHCQLKAADSPRLQRVMAELSVCGFIHVVRCFHAHWQPEHVSFEYPAPSYRHEYARVFQHAERFDQPFTGLCFERSLLSAAGLHKDEGIHAALRALAEQRLLRLAQRAPYAVRVREHLLQEGRLAQRDMHSVASALGLSVRSLRRRLAAEGKSYADVEAEAFACMARRLLLDSALTIQQTAYQLGFSGANTFHRAFKRATGMTPSAFREAQLGRRIS